MKQVTVRKKCPDCGKELIANGRNFSTASNPSYSSYEHDCGCNDNSDKVLVLSNLNGTITTSTHVNSNGKWLDQAYPYTYIEYEKHEKEERWE